MTESFAREIGADGYGADAVTAVEVALKLLNEKESETGKKRMRRTQTPERKFPGLRLFRPFSSP